MATFKEGFSDRVELDPGSARLGDAPDGAVGAVGSRRVRAARSRATKSRAPAAQAGSAMPPGRLRERPHARASSLRRDVRRELRCFDWGACIDVRRDRSRNWPSAERRAKFRSLGPTRLDSVTAAAPICRIKKTCLFSCANNLLIADSCILHREKKRAWFLVSPESTSTRHVFLSKRGWLNLKNVPALLRKLSFNCRYLYSTPRQKSCLIFWAFLGGTRTLI